MHSITQKSNKKPFIIITALILLLVGGTAAALFIPASPFALNKAPVEDRPENSVDYKEPTSDQKKAGDEAKEEFIDKQEASKTPSNQPTTSGSVGVTISSANQNDQTYQIRTIIEALDASGTCTLTLLKDGQTPVTMQAGTQILGSYSVCKGFDIDTSTLAKGDWQLKITYKGSGGEGSAQQSIGVK